MSEQKEPVPFVITKGYRLFADLCDACRRFPSIGLGYGPPGTGKTESARYYAGWEHLEPFLPEPLITFTGRSAVDGFFPYKPLTFSSAPPFIPIQGCRTVFYTPPVSGSPGRIEREVMTLFAAFSYLVEAATEHHQGKEEFLLTRRFSPLIELLIVDEANRLKEAWIEQLRDIYDRGHFGMILLGMPGLEKRLSRAPQLYSRIGFAHQIQPLSEEETRFFLDQRWSHRMSAHSKDFTDQEAVSAILRITGGNIRLIERLMKQVEYVLMANPTVSVVTKEVVEAARQNLLLGPH
jgi:DNA transposition AAA+ family ATPase